MAQKTVKKSQLRDINRAIDLQTDLLKVDAAEVEKDLDRLETKLRSGSSDDLVNELLLATHHLDIAYENQINVLSLLKAIVANLPSLAKGKTDLKVPKAIRRELKGWLSEREARLKAIKQYVK